MQRNDVTCKNPTLPHQFVIGTEQVTSRVHHEHQHKVNAPRIDLGLIVSGLPNEYTRSTVELLGQLSISLRPENWAGHGFEVEYRELLWAQGETALFVRKIVYSVGVKLF